MECNRPGPPCFAFFAEFFRVRSVIAGQQVLDGGHVHIIFFDFFTGSEQPELCERLDGGSGDG